MLALSGGAVLSRFADETPLDALHFRSLCPAKAFRHQTSEVLKTSEVLEGPLLFGTFIAKVK